MSRTRTPIIKPARLARELAELAAELAGPPELAALAVFGRFLFTDANELQARVDELPDVARARWVAALGLLNAPSGNLVATKLDELSGMLDRENFWSRIDRDTSPVLPEGRLFELFLHAVDRQQGRRRGVYYTPQPLVHFLLRSVRQALVDQFDGAVQINWIDPACGYGGFLLAAAKQSVAQRTTGCEICPITWATAHLLLASTGCGNIELLHCNPLEQGESLRESLLGTDDARLMPVIVGNPPWSNFGRQNRSPWISELLADYRTGLAERKSNLADDSIKFLRWGQYWIEQAGRGILAFVTPSTWLDGLTHRRMRESLLATFDDLSIVDLHGDVDEDENVFGVRSGVAVVVLVKRGTPHSTFGRARLLPSRSSIEQSRLSGGFALPVIGTIRRLDLVGSRSSKLARLDQLDQLDSETATPLQPHPPDWSLALPRAAPTTGYSSFWPLDRIFRQYISGVQTKNDAVFVGFTREELSEQVQAWLASRQSPIKFDPVHIRPYLVAPFDRRWVYYDPRLIGRARYKVLRHMLRPNLGLVFMRQSTAAGQYDHFLAVDSLVSDRVFYSRRGAPFVAPLWLLSWEGEAPAEPGSGKDLVLSTEYSVLSTNFDPTFITEIMKVVAGPFDPSTLFHYLYAVCHASTYRRRYDAELRRDFPRLPLPTSAESFRRFSEFGHELVDLHLLKTKAERPRPSLVPANRLECEIRVGGYEVIRRWRAQRKAREATDADLRYVKQLEFVAVETERLAREIDRVYVESFSDSV